MRDNSWLEQQLKEVWGKYFSDIKELNPVEIKFGRKARSRFGSIKITRQRRGFFYKKISPKDKSTITINGHFKNPFIPEEIIILTIAHEMVHYAHGFSSAHPRLYRYPHQGGIVVKELIDRGLANMVKLQRIWIKNNWLKFVLKEEKYG